MAQPSDDPSVFAEPHMRPLPPPAPVAPAGPAETVLPYAAPHTPSPRDYDMEQDVRFEPAFAPPGVAVPATVDHTVWDEPGLAPELVGQVPHGHPTYAAWLSEQQAGWTAGESWLVTVGLALLAGPMAIVGAFWGGGQTIFSIFALVLIGPVTEEVMKIAGPTLVVEKWPFVFRHGWQILLCAFCGGLAFGVIENLIYLHIYLDNPSPRIIFWRWTVCTALHTTCSLIAGVGVLRAWRITMDTRARPPLAATFPYLVAACILHGAYNAAALVLEAVHFF